MIIRVLREYRDPYDHFHNITEDKFRYCDWNASVIGY